MFTTGQTRLFLLLMLVIVVLLSFIGLNFKQQAEEKKPMVAILEVPEVEPGSVREVPRSRVDESKAKIIDLTTDEVPPKKKKVKKEKKQQEFPGELEDTGKTIIFD